MGDGRLCTPGLPQAWGSRRCRGCCDGAVPRCVRGSGFIFLSSVFLFSQVSTERNCEVTASLRGGHSTHSLSHSVTAQQQPQLTPGWVPCQGQGEEGPCEQDLFPTERPGQHLL